MSRITDLKRFYALFDELGRRTSGPRTLDALSQFRDWPQRGVYFFFDPNEQRQESGIGPRLVRVGTHALTNGSKSTLRGRLSQHRGKVSGGGNHRGSIFRSLVGQALLQCGALSACPSWGVKGAKGKAADELGISRAALTADEDPVELAVSAYLTKLPFLWLDIDDEPSSASLRGLVEQNSIALLSNYERPALDPPSPSWLGLHSNRPLVRKSGLWNQNHVTEVHDPKFLDVLEKLIQQTTVQP